MDTGTTAILVSVITLLVVAFMLWKNRDEPLTADSLVATVEEAVPIAQTLAEVATIGVQAAEQLFATGRLPRDERLAYALNYVKQWSPALSSLDNEKILGAIESAVLVANALRAQADKAKGIMPGV